MVLMNRFQLHFRIIFVTYTLRTIGLSQQLLLYTPSTAQTRQIAFLSSLDPRQYCHGRVKRDD